MDLTFSAETEAFRQDVTRFLDTEFPRDILEKSRAGASLTTAEVRRSEMALGARGWLATAWPAEYGGPGWTLEQQYVFDEVLERAGVPTVTPMGVIYVGPVIYTFGTDAQKDKWLPGIRDGSQGWAQGYSEPSSGSDLASLQFSAVRDGDHYILNGEKVWTSAAQHADWIFLLARTDNSGKKQEGITFLCCEMDRDGVTCHPIITLDGKHYLNRVTFDNVRVPIDYRIGEEGKGWTYSQYLLGFERTSYARIAGKRQMLAGVRALARATGSDRGGGGSNHRLIDDPDFAQKLGRADIAVDGLEMQVFRILSAVSAGGSPGNEASIVKILATETHQQITELMLEAGARASLAKTADATAPDWAGDNLSAAYAPPAVAAYLAGRAQSIYGGTNEIQKNIIAKRVLGL
ncbi:MAG: acyl-CoA dehydrogenase family protein [Pseudomonadota bacterium]